MQRQTSPQQISSEDDDEQDDPSIVEILSSDESSSDVNIKPPRTKKYKVISEVLCSALFELSLKNVQK